MNNMNATFMSDQETTSSFYGTESGRNSSFKTNGPALNIAKLIGSLYEEKKVRAETPKATQEDEQEARANHFIS